MFHFQRNYFFLSLAIFLSLIYIAIYVNDQFVRPFLGDVLVVFFLYFFLKSLIKIKNYYLAHSVLIFAFLVEFSQYFNLVNVLGLQDNQLARIIIGATFDVLDLLAYTIAWAVIFIVDYYWYRK